MTAEDLLQDAWVTLYLALARPRVFRDEAALTGYMRHVVDGIVSHRVRAGHAAKRAHGEESLDVRRHDRAVLAPDPAVRAAVADEWHHLLEMVCPQDARLLAALDAGDSVAAAAASAGMHPRTARRRLAVLRPAITVMIWPVGY